MAGGRLYVVAGKVTDSVTYGFLPAAARLGLDVTVLTDRPADHARVCDARVAECDVTDYRAIVSAIAADEPACAVFSNSDHLQAATALAAAFFALPGKDWRAALRAKNKALMRRTLGGVFAAEVGERPPDGPYPLVLKPREGVASEDVYLVRDPAELAARIEQVRARRPGPLMVEEYLPGDLHTLETLNGRVLGSFHTTLSRPPHFIEERLDWAPPPHADQVLAQLGALGVGFGACHTEYVVSEGRVRIIEVNYRIIGDHCDFLLADLLGVPVFEWVLRAHLGEPVPAVPETSAHAAVDSVIAQRSGTLTAAPGREETEDGEVRLTYWPIRAAGDTIALSRTNRDFLGTIRAVGPSRAGVDDALLRFRARHRWEIAP